MSKNITIQEGGVGKNFTADKIKTDLSAGGETGWVPEDGKQLTDLNVVANGTYVAANAGYYGYSTVTVNGCGRVTGIGSDGNEHFIHNDNSGNLVDTLVPSSIEVITPPNNPYGTYTDGQTIDYTGMVVKAYTQTGDEFTNDGQYPNGIIPISELTLPVTKADYYDSDIWYESTAEINGETFTVSYGSILIWSVTYWKTHALTVNRTWNSRSAKLAAMWPSEDTAGWWYLFTSKTPSATVTAHSYNIDDGSEASGSPSTGVIGTYNYTYDNKTVYYDAGSASYVWTLPWKFEPKATMTNARMSSMDGKLAWAMEYGTSHYGGGGQVIPVKWPRTGDGKVLETSFVIRVAPPYSSDGE